MANTGDDFGFGGRPGPARPGTGPEQWIGQADPLESFGTTIEQALQRLTIELAGLRAERDGLRLELEGIRTQLELTQQQLADRDRFASTVRELGQIVQQLSAPSRWPGDPAAAAAAQAAIAAPYTPPPPAAPYPPQAYAPPAAPLYPPPTYQSPYAPPVPEPSPYATPAPPPPESYGPATFRPPAAPVEPQPAPYVAPVAPQPEPAAYAPPAAPEPTLYAPPVAPQPEPVAYVPPVAPQPEPVAYVPPAAPEPEPVAPAAPEPPSAYAPPAPEPEPVAPQPEPVAYVPPAAPEPEPAPQPQPAPSTSYAFAGDSLPTSKGPVVAVTEESFFSGPGVWIGEPPKADDRRHALKTWGTRIGTAVAGLVVAMVFIVSIGPKFLPYQMFFVRSGSMHPTFDTGDMVVLTKVDASDLKKGDIITFDRPDKPGTLVTHRIIGIQTNEQGRSFQTKGDANGTADPWSVPATGTGWKYKAHIPKLGFLFGYLGTPQARLALLAIPALLLGILSIIDIWKPQQPQARRRR